MLLMTTTTTIIIISPHHMHSIRKMRPVATDGVAWSLSLSVCLCMCVGRVHEP